MKKTSVIILLAIAAWTTSCSKKTEAPPVTPPVVAPPVVPPYTPPPLSANGDVVGKVVVGYQGWFSALGDGSPSNSWNHQNIEIWPDMREYTNAYAGSRFSQATVTQPAFFGTLGDGVTPAKMFSGYDQSTTDLHFKWMQQYGIDCAAVQRFGSELTNTKLKAQRDGVANHVKIAAEATGRKFYIMYDISSWTNFQTEIKADWTNYMKALTTSTAYAVQNSKPVVCIWGVGFSDRPGNVTSWKDVLQWFKDQGCYVIVGAPVNFSTDFGNQPAYNTANMIMPWRVGNTTSAGPMQSQDNSDIAYCTYLGIDYQADMYAGFAFNNSNTSKPKNEIPRAHGDFLWSQFAAAKNAGIKSVYVSMFDEVNEATAIFKCAEDANMSPAGKYFLTLDADGTHVSSDFYLRLTRDGMKMINGTIPYQATHTTPFL